MMVLRRVTGRRERRTWLLRLLPLLSFLTLLYEVESLAPPSLSTRIQRGLALPSPSGVLRIRRTVESDLSTVASFLSTASVQKGSFSWMERIWARHDIEGLLKRRLRAVTEGQKAKARLDHLNSNIYSASMDDKLYLEHLWWSSDRLRIEIEAAARETGEDSVWQQCGTQFPPDSIHWLNHIQMTACTADGTVVGFCEIAMLSNPTATATSSSQDEKWLIALNDGKRNKDGSDDDSFLDHHHHHNNKRYYSPAITNLAVASEYRRQGVGRRLLSRAETYVQRHWKAPALGLYVQDVNAAANALYEQRGYIAQTAVHDERLGRLWYRSKALLRGHEKDQDDRQDRQQQPEVSRRSESFKEEDARVALSSR